MRNYDSTNKKSHNMTGFLRRILSVTLIVVIICASSMAAMAYFADSIMNVNNVIATAFYSIDAVETTSGTYVAKGYEKSNVKTESAAERTFRLTAKGTATTGHCKITIGEDVYYTQ